MAEFIGEYRGYVLCVPTSGGKAGRNNNKTSSLQIRNGNMIVKRIRFKIGTDPKEIVSKAKRIIDERRREIRMMS
jgi:hypothetical protein